MTGCGVAAVGCAGCAEGIGAEVATCTGGVGAGAEVADCAGTADCAGGVDVGAVCAVWDGAVSVDVEGGCETGAVVVAAAIGVARAARVPWV